jgi:hypothetical protein
MPIIGSTGSASAQSVGGFQALAFTAEVLVVGGGGRGGEAGFIATNQGVGAGGGGGGGVQYRRNHKLRRNHSHNVRAGNGGGHTTRYNGQKSSITGILYGTLEAVGGGQGSSDPTSGSAVGYLDTATGTGDGSAVSGASGGGGAGRNNNYPNFGHSDGGVGNDFYTPNQEPISGLGKDGRDGMSGDDIPTAITNDTIASGGGGGGALEDGVTGQDALNKGYAGGKGFISSLSGTSVGYGNGGGPGIASDDQILSANWWDFALVLGGAEVTNSGSLEKLSGRGGFTYESSNGLQSISGARNGEPGTGDGGGGGANEWTNTNYTANPSRGGSGTVIVRIKNSRYSSQTSGTATTSDGYTTIVWALPSGSSSYQLFGTLVTV